MRYLIWTAGLCFGIMSCNSAGSSKKPEEGQKVIKYHSKEIGWTISIPKGYELIGTEDLDADTKKGLKMMEGTLGTEIDASGMKYLANFKKNQFNQFQSSIEPFDTIADGNWYEHDHMLKVLIFETFTQQGVSVDSSETETVLLSGKQFQHYTISIYAQDKQVILKQDIYGAFLNGYTFGANINYNDSAAYKEMLQAWQSSTFQ